MSGKSSPSLAKRVSQITQRVSSAFSPSNSVSSPSRQPFHLPQKVTQRLAVPTDHIDNQLPVTSTPHQQSTSNVTVHSVSNSAPAHVTYLAEASTYQSSSSLHLVSSVLPPLPQGHVSTVQGTNHPQYLSPGTLSHAHGFVMKNPVFIDNTTDSFMKDFLQHTIIGAGFDSSARNPPPRCHPGTRVSILQRCLDFVTESSDKEKLRWVVGPAGVGKSAVMQFIAENVPDGVVCASVFLSVDGRQDGTKVIATIAYQLAVKDGPYHQFIRNEIRLDADLPQKALSVQFKKFIVEPFIENRLLDPSRRLLVLIDGLDECDNIASQQEILSLITNFCITYPTSPVTWIIASRPEPHITLFFDKAQIARTYVMEEIIIDSEEACEDVKRYLRNQLNEVKLTSPTLQHKPHWPSKHVFTKISAAAGGLFAYASTVVDYVSNPSRGNPVTLLRDVIEVIDGIKVYMLPGNDHPMDHLDALYARIITNIPGRVEQDTRKLLLLCSDEYRGLNTSFRLQCNLLRLTEDAAYGAVHHTYSVVKVPKPVNADTECLGFFHNSFQHYLCDFERSKFFRDAGNEADELATQVSLRVVGEVPDDSAAMASGGGTACEDVGYLKGGPDACTSINLSWGGDERFKLTDDQLRFTMYRHALADVAFRFRPGRTAFTNLSCFRALTTRFTAPGSKFRHYELQCFAFDHFRDELTKRGILKLVPLRTLDYAAICGGIGLRFFRSAGTDTGLPDPWNPSCKHEKQKIDDSMGRQGWTTKFGKSPATDASKDSVGNNADTLTPRPHCFDGNLSLGPLHDELPSEVEHCHHCFQRLSLLLANHPNQLATVFVASTNICYVELSMDDPDDGMLQFRYRFCHSRPPTCNDV